MIAFTFLLFLILIDFYSYKAISSLKNVNLFYKVIQYFFIVSAIPVYICILLYTSGYISDPSALTRNLIGGLFVVLYLSKIFMIPLLLSDEIRRLSLILRQSVKYFYSKNIDDKPSLKNEGLTRSQFISKMALATASVPLFGLTWGITNGAYNYKIHKQKLIFPKLPESWHGLKIVQISDIHSGSFTDENAVERGIQLILDQKPDIIFFTGDLVNSVTEEFDNWFTAFNRLEAPLGIYSVLGNHDYGLYAKWDSEELRLNNVQKMIETHSRLGWKLLQNEHVILEKNNEKISIIGVENWGKKKRFPRYGRLRKAATGTEEIPFNILLSHDPSHWDAQVKKFTPHIDLTLSGHTHGMQFGFEIPGVIKWSPAKYMFKQWAGLYTDNEQYLYVNRGFGFLGYPGRIGIMPEITVIELQKA